MLETVEIIIRVCAWIVVVLNIINVYLAFKRNRSTLEKFSVCLMMVIFLMVTLFITFVS